MRNGTLFIRFLWGIAKKEPFFCLPPIFQSVTEWQFVVESPLSWRKLDLAVESPHLLPPVACARVFLMNLLVSS